MTPENCRIYGFSYNFQLEVYADRLCGLYNQPSIWTGTIMKHVGRLGKSGISTLVSEFIKARSTAQNLGTWTIFFFAKVALLDENRIFEWETISMK
jgi:hypothetical protein